MSKETDADIRRMGIEDSAGFKNLMAIRDYSTDTRKEVRNLELSVKELKGLIVQQNQVIQQLRGDLSRIMSKVYSGGKTQ